MAVKAAYEHRASDLGEIKIAVMVFDAHADIFHHYNKPVVKANPFSKLLDDQNVPVNETVIIGVPKTTYQEVIQDRDNFLFDPNMKKRVRIIDESEYIDGGVVNEMKIRRHLGQVAEQWTDSGVSNIIVSVDADVLRMWKMKYTSSEYGPFHAVTFLAQQNFDNIDEDEIIKKLIWFQKDTHRDNPMAWNDERVGGLGLSLGEIGRTIEFFSEESRKHDMNIGIPLSSGGKFIGDITEVGYPDYNGRTGRAVGNLANHMMLL